MSSNTNFTEWTREEKEKFAQKRMAEMKLKNDMLKRRHAEVEFDRMTAEKQNSAITNASKAVKKDTNKDGINIKFEISGEQKVVEHQREWDRGKPDIDNWKAPQHSAPIKSSRTAYNKRDFEQPPRDSRTDNHNVWQRDVSGGQRLRTTIDRREKDSFPRNKSFDSYRYGPTLDSRMKSKREFRSKQYDNHHRYKSPEKRTGFAHRTNESYRKPHAYSEEKIKKHDYNRYNAKKKFSSGAHSQSTSRSDSDHVDNPTSMKISSRRVESLWENDKVSEDRNKQNRTESWVKSVSGRSYSRWDNESSDEDCSHKNFLSKMAPGEIKSAECSTAYNPENLASAQMESNVLKSVKVTTGIKLKRSPQSLGSSKNEHGRKQRRFDRGFREEDASKYPNFKQQSNIKAKDDSWNNLSVGNKNVRNERSLKKTSNFVKAKTLNKNYDDSWGPVTQESRISSVKKSLGDDDMWETAEQSDVKWNLSDDETTLMKSEKGVSETQISLNTWNENQLPSDKKSGRIAAKNYKSQKLHSNGDSFKNQEVVQAYIGDDDDPDNLWNKFKPNSVNVETKDSYKNQEAEQADDEDPDNLWSKFKQDSYNVDSSKSKRKVPESTGVFKSGQNMYDLNDPAFLSEKLKESCKISDEMETVEDKIVHSSDDSWLTEEGGTYCDDKVANNGKKKDSTPQ